MKQRTSHRVMKPTKSILAFLLPLVLWNKSSGQLTSNIQNLDIKPFEANILNSDYSMAYGVSIVLTNKDLKIIFKSDLVGEKDSVLFYKAISPSDTLRQISEIDLNNLKDFYSNSCIQDGSQITVVLKKGVSEKRIHLSNYYQEDIGKLIYLVNSIIPDRYRVWYDKRKLEAEYKKCGF
jgi:uncharacterized protein (DUF608 family)